MGLDFKTTMLITEALGDGHSFSVSFSAHTGIGTLPILYYGNEEQKKKYVPGMASGDLKGCYCLTEPGSGSDANSGKTTAKLTEDGKHYVINGQKMWITNGGFADVMIVFAKIDDDENLTGVHRGRRQRGDHQEPRGKEDGHQGVVHPPDLLQRRQGPGREPALRARKGFKIAVNILNIGRIKLGGAVLGGAGRSPAR